MIVRGVAGRRGWTPAARAAAVIAIASSLVACGGPSGPTDSAASSRGDAASASASSVASATSVASGTAVASATPSASAGPAPSATSGALLEVDARLLDVLPPVVEGVALEPDPATAATLVDEPDLAASASAVAIGRYIGPGDSSGPDIAVASVIQLRPGVFSEPFFATWRREFDASACEAAGGVAGDATEVAIASFAVQSAACVEGAATYHVRLEGDILVSMLAAGPSGLGEAVVAGLRP